MGFTEFERSRQQSSPINLTFESPTWRTSLSVDLDELVDIENTFVGIQVMSLHPEIWQAGKFVVYELGRAMAVSSSIDEAKDIVRNLDSVGFFDYDPYSRAFLSGSGKIDQLYQETKDAISLFPDARLQLINRVNTVFPSALNSIIDQQPVRPLERYLDDGFKLQLNQEGAEGIQRFYHDN